MSGRRKVIVRTRKTEDIEKGNEKIGTENGSEVISDQDQKQ